MSSPSTPEPKWCDVGGVTTRYFDIGSGHPLVLIHGGGIDYRFPESAASWFAAAGVLARRFRVILPDKLGCGGTGEPLNGDYSIGATTRHATLFMETLALGPAVVGGHSRGVLPALTIALESPGLVSHVVALNTNTFGHDDVVVDADFYVRDLPDPLGLPSRESIAGLFGRLFHGDSPQRQHYFESMIEAIEAASTARPTTPAGVARRMALDEQVYRPSIRAQAAKVLAAIAAGELTRPLLVAWGFDDRSSPFALCERFFAEAASHGNPVALAVANHAGHYPHIEHPEWFARSVTAWVDSLGATERF